MSSKDKDKKKKTAKLEKKDTKIQSVPDLEQSQLIARVISRGGDKETKNLANNEDDPYMQTFTSSYSNGVSQMNNFSGIQSQQQLSNNFQRSTDYNTNQFTSDSTQEEYRSQLNNIPYYQQQTQPMQNYQQYYHKQHYHMGNQDQNDYRFESIRNQINQNLLPKRQEILYQIQKIENRIEEIKYQTQKIENMTREEFDCIIERLRSTENQKLQRLYQDKDELISNIEYIDSLQSYALNNQEQVPSIKILGDIERMAKVRIKTQIDIYSNDLPQEFVQLKQSYQQSIIQQQMIEFKNEMIWKLMNDSKAEILKIKAELEQQVQQEYQKWQNIEEKYQEELNKYKLQCTFCGINFDDRQINSNCQSNFKNARLQFECEEVPQELYIGTNRHFFSKSKQLQESQMQIQNKKV
ncbi:unnamed protein product (macronuclear) [Paramecium tetraurelia]|uniref:Uncharacterized protein n=1 Tax=Paramecium tetraurelia TaxID=5888 RepID=A0CIL6_PARTE|nr:uncharacterized protein GSPATT00007768001 [Paramecium tetraurelia]CAK70633.1 unnamed protein product [Paramecium tetraurelia]|eukprot:XP_001438030.1 hypothetical protein (macronuclear) [Paramecium tetraurelia strain d4-2]